MPSLVSTNPATMEVIGTFEAPGDRAMLEAVARARAAASNWASLGVARRAKLLRSVQDVIVERSAELIEIVCRETGKPRTEALTGEIFITLYVLRYFRKHAARILRPRRVRSAFLKNKRFYLTYAPYGVVGVISPGNFPIYLSMMSIVPALLAGNAVICKISEYTPFTGKKLDEMFRLAGFPDGVVQVIPGGGATGSALIAAGVDKLVFTGSVATGRKVAEAAGTRLIPTVLELGGKDAAIVCRDAPLERAAHALVWGAFCNAGQVCASVERVYVVEDVAERFLDLVVRYTKTLRQGIEADSVVDVGPLGSERQLLVVESHVRDALERGARLLLGGKRREGLPGYFHEPTVLSGVDHSMKIMREETFGPVLSVMVVANEEEALQLANDSTYGLTASVWTRDRKKAAQLASCLQAGTIVINDCQSGASTPELPWGGVKESGYGRSLSSAGLLEFVHSKVISVDVLRLRRDPVWYPYSETLFRALSQSLPMIFGSFPLQARLLKQLLRRST